MAVEGTLDTFNLAEILQVISHQQKTGILTVQGENNIVAVSFLRGQVVAADALNKTVEEGLGEVLVRQSVLSRGEFDAAVRRHHGGSGRLLDLLVDSGRLVRDQLLAALRQQTQELLLEVFDWQQGEFKFYGGDEVSYEEGFVPIPVEELLVRWLEARGEEVGISAVPAVFVRADPVPVEIRERLGEPRPGEDQGGVVWLSSEEGEIWNLLREDQTVSSLAAATGLDPYKTRFALHRLIKAGAVEVRGLDRGDVEPARVEPARVEPAPPPEPEPEARPSRPPAPPPAPVAPIAIAPTAAPVVEAPVAQAAPTVARRRAFSDPVRWIAGGLALALAVGLAAVLLRSPESLLLPFPWQEGERSALVSAQLAAESIKIDRAAKTFFLLEGRFPDSLDRLVALGLLDGGELAGPGGRRIVYTAGEESYTLATPDGIDASATEAEGANEVAGATEAITGNFLLDPDFLAPAASAESPLVLLD